MQPKAAPARFRRHGWVVLALGIGLLAALPVWGDDARQAGGITEQLALVAPPQMVAAKIFSPVKEFKVRPRGGGVTATWMTQDFSLAAGGLESEAHQADVLITVQSSAVGETVVELLGGVGARRPAQLRLAGGRTTIRAGDGPVTVTANAQGQIVGTLISSDTLNAVVVKAGGKVSPQIRFAWENNDAPDAWLSQPMIPVPGTTLTELVTLKMDGQPLDGHRLHFYVKRVEIEDDEGNRTQREFTPEHPGDVYAVYEQAEYVTNSHGEVHAKLTVKDRPEVVNIVRSYTDESVYLADATGRVLPATRTPASHQSVEQPLGKTTELIQRLKRFGASLAHAPAKNNAHNAALLATLRQEVADHPAQRPALAYYVAELYALAGDSQAAVEWAMPLARDKNDPNCAEARGILLRCGVAWETPSASTPKSEGDALLRALADVYPCGRESDELAGQSTARSHSPANWNNLVPQDYDAAEQAGDLYHDMHMLPEAVHAYRLALGLHGDFFTRESARVWMHMGDCLMDQGVPLQALSCYYKSLAGGQPLQDITHRIRRAQGDLAAPAAVPVPPQPDAAVLEQIASLLADTNLFDDALSAAQAAAQVRGTPTELVATLHRKNAAWMRQVLQIAGEGTMVRGVKVTAGALAAVEAAAR